jgi:hypothetical protein
MPEREFEPLPVTLRARIVNPDADRYPSEGQNVDVLDEEEFVGGPWAQWLRGLFRLPQQKRRTTWVVLRFADGQEGAYHLSEVETTNV